MKAHVPLISPNPGAGRRPGLQLRDLREGSPVALWDADEARLLEAVAYLGVERHEPEGLTRSALRRAVGLGARPTRRHLRRLCACGALLRCGGPLRPRYRVTIVGLATLLELADDRARVAGTAG